MVHGEPNVVPDSVTVAVLPEPFTAVLEVVPFEKPPPVAAPVEESVPLSVTVKLPEVSTRFPGEVVPDMFEMLEYLVQLVWLVGCTAPVPPSVPPCQSVWFQV